MLNYHKVSNRYMRLKQQEITRAMDVYGPDANVHKIEQEAMIKLIIELIEENKNLNEKN